MSDLVDFSIFPASVQAYATVGVSVILGFVGIYGYYKKFRGETVSAVAAGPSLDTLMARLEDQNATICSHLETFGNALGSGITYLEEIRTMMKDKVRRDELEREFQRGRDAQVLEAQKTLSGRPARQQRGAEFSSHKEL